MRLDWLTGQKHEEGVDRGVFYPNNGVAEAWDGLSSVNQSIPDLRDLVVYQNGVKVVKLLSEGAFAGVINAFSYPLSLTSRLVFGFSYRVMTDNGYQIHIVYNARATPSKYSYTMSQVSDFSFDISTIPVPVPNARPTAHLVVDSEIAWPAAVSAIEDILYGTDTTDPRLPLPQELIDLIDANSMLRITDNGDGTFTMDGPDSLIQMLTSDEFSVDWPSVTYLNADTYTISSL